MVGSGRPEGSLACVARWARSALRDERVCSRVDFLARRAFRRGLKSDAVGLFCEVVVVSVLCSGLFSEEDGGAGGGFMLGDSCGWEDIVGVVLVMGLRWVDGF